jgi:hypothetical protein
MKLIRVGVDLAMNVFQVHGLDRNEQSACPVVRLRRDGQRHRPRNNCRKINWQVISVATVNLLVAIERRICQGAGDRYAAIAEAVWRYRTSDSKRINSFLTTA